MDRQIRKLGRLMVLEEKKKKKTVTALRNNPEQYIIREFL